MLGDIEPIPTQYFINLMEEILEKNRKNQTNEKWFCALSTEAKAIWLEEKMTWAAQEQGTLTAKGWAKWLKQPHINEEQ